MSLIRQIWLLLLGTLLLAFLGSFAVWMASSQGYLETQLRMKNADNAQALAGKAAAEVASDIGEIQGLGRSMAQTLGAAHAAGVRDRKVLS